MGKPIIYIDGEAGTTGLQIQQRLQGRGDIELLLLKDKRRDDAARKEALNKADLVILCLPDDAARNAVTLIDNPNVRVIDASTAHRTADGWVYGFPEYKKGSQRAKIASAKRVSNPGCYALASISLIEPLISGGLIPADYNLRINAVSGYSGGGKAMVAEFADKSAANYNPHGFDIYGLGLNHKHMPEIARHSGLENPPLFVPSVGNFAQGMAVQLPLFAGELNKPIDGAGLTAHYQDAYSQIVASQIHVIDFDKAKAQTRLYPEKMEGKDHLDIYVFADAGEKRLLAVALLDNLGKGASGQAIQNMEIMLGL